MGSHSWLQVNGHILYGVREGFDPAILGLFRDHEARSEVTTYDALGDGDFETDVDVWYESTSCTISGRLDALGFTLGRAYEALEGLGLTVEEIHDIERWLGRFSVAYPRDDLDAEIALHSDDLTRDPPEAIYRLDSKMLLRLVLHSAGGQVATNFQLGEVTRFYPEFGEGPPPDICQQYFESHYVHSPSYGPLVVLTEGKTDAEFLSAGLALLHPHLVDCVRFLDYLGHRPAGGAGEVVKTVKAFAAAGIQNRLVAVLDNDTAAAEALRSIHAIDMPDNIRIVQLPHLAYLESYPAIGPTGCSESDVNGVAAAIEFYFCEEVLLDDDRSKIPIQWTGYNQAVGRYQGELTDKARIQGAIRRQIDEHEGAGSTPDWPFMREALAVILGHP